LVNDCEVENELRNIYLVEYSQPTVIARYLSDTGVPAFTYLVRTVYTSIYQEIVKTLVSHNPERHGFRILEYGCGGGMNLVQLIRLFQAQGAQLTEAIGTDFSPPMIDAARNEAKQQLSVELNAVTTYVVARHETITRDLASGLGVSLGELQNTFDLILGVNTFRYAHRLKKDETFARELFTLLRPGGYSIMIDMNRGFRFVGSHAHDLCTRAKQRYYIPSVRQYSGPFLKAGFLITRARTFYGLTRLASWVPASAEVPLHSLFWALRSALDTYLSPFARHALLIAKKPVHVGCKTTPTACLSPVENIMS
jgi:SAM-dependent methyltransferase